MSKDEVNIDLNGGFFFFLHFPDLLCQDASVIPKIETHFKYQVCSIIGAFTCR